MPVFHFADTLRQGRRFACYPITMFAVCRQIDNQHIAAAEFAVPKRIMKRAVRRNRAKRQMRAAYRDIARDVVFAGCVHLIFFYAEKAELPFDVIKAGMRQAIEEFCNLSVNA